jgi:hypothetical protein
MIASISGEGVDGFSIPRSPVGLPDVRKRSGDTASQIILLPSGAAFAATAAACILAAAGR